MLSMNLFIQPTKWPNASVALALIVAMNDVHRHFYSPTVFKGIVSGDVIVIFEHTLTQ